MSPIYLLGQAPGPHEGKFGRPFAWTAGKTLFRWFSRLGVEEERFRSSVYMAAVARCFPGKAEGGGDRRPDGEEIKTCRAYFEEEVRILRPRLLLPVGSLAIESLLNRKVKLAEVIGEKLSIRLNDQKCEVICLPHPSGASTWHRMQPGINLLEKALQKLAEHPDWKATFP